VAPPPSPTSSTGLFADETDGLGLPGRALPTLVGRLPPCGTPTAAWLAPSTQSARRNNCSIGLPEGRATGFRHPAVVVTAQRFLDAQPNVIQVVPLTATVRGFMSEVTIEPDIDNNLQRQVAAQRQHIRPVSTGRVDQVHGSVGPTVLSHIRDTVGLILDVPI